MRLLNESPPYDLTYSDVFMVPSLSSVPSRFDVDLTTPDRLGTTIPVVVGQHDRGRRPAHGRDRRPSRRPHRAAAGHPARRHRDGVVDYVKSRHTVYDTPITLSPHAHGRRRARPDPQARRTARSSSSTTTARPVGIFTEHDAVGFDRFTPAAERDEPSDLITIEAGTDPTRSTTGSSGQRLSVAPVVDDDGSLDRLRHPQGRAAQHHLPAGVDDQGRLRIAVAVGINGDPATKAKSLLAMGVDVLVIDTAHGHQTRTLRAIEEVRAVAPDAPIVAGNVVTAAGTRDLIEAGADVVKVGVGPGAMCTTRMMTGVGRPQF